MLIFAIFLGSGDVTKAITTNNSADEELRTFTIILQSVYLDGEVSEETVVHHGTTLKEQLDYYQDRGWEIVQLEPGQLVFKKYVQDISPLLKVNGYFGLGQDGTLSTFHGKPEEQNIIQSFFQIDIDKLETRMQEELAKGIPVRNKQDFLQVLETYKQYRIVKEYWLEEVVKLWTNCEIFHKHIESLLFKVIIKVNRIYSI